MSPCRKACSLSLLRAGSHAWILLTGCHYIYPVLSWLTNQKDINSHVWFLINALKMTWHLAQAPCQGGGQGLFCRDLTGVKVMGSEGIPAAQWYQVSSQGAHALLGTGSRRHSGPWQALPGDSGPATACSPGLSPLAQPALGQSAHKWALGRLCQAAGGGESRERHTRRGERLGCPGASLCLSS